MSTSKYEQTKIAIYMFSLEGEKNGPLKGWKKVLHRIASVYTTVDCMSWYYGLHVKAAFGIIVRFILGIPKQ